MSTSKASVNLFTFPTRRASESNESHLRNYPPNEDIFPLNYPRSCNIVRCNSQNKYSWSQLFEGSSGICSSCFFIVLGPEHEPCAPAGRLGLQSSVTTSSPARFWRSLLSEKSEGQPRGNGVGVSRRASREPGWAGSPNLQGVPLPCPHSLSHVSWACTENKSLFSLPSGIPGPQSASRTVLTLLS